nr:MAG TPA: hypothetical protein [Caudoviricetes sp.]
MKSPKDIAKSRFYGGLVFVHPFRLAWLYDTSRNLTLQ